MEGKASEIFEKYEDRRVSYKGVPSGCIAGFTDNYVIIGFPDKTGCIKSFSDKVTHKTYWGEKGEIAVYYKSYRFAKPKNIELYRRSMTIKDFKRYINHIPSELDDFEVTFGDYDDIKNIRISPLDKKVKIYNHPDEFMCGSQDGNLLYNEKPHFDIDIYLKNKPK